MPPKLNSLETERIFTLKHLSVALGVPLDVLEFFAERAPGNYHPFIAHKGDKARKIANPNEAIKSLQRKILKKLLTPVTLPSEIFGARKGRDIRGNVLQHVGKKVLVTIDIRDCFPNVSFRRIFSLYREQFGYSEEVASVLTKLTTFRGSLPQGGATSSMLLNILLIPLVMRMKDLCLVDGNTLSFWVDDIAISGNQVHLLCQPLIRELQKFGFQTRSKKVKVMFAGERHELTGLMANDGVSVPKKKLEQYIAEARSGVASRTTTDGRQTFVDHISHTQGRRLKIRTKMV